MIDSIIPLLSLIALEVILGIDNIIFISILSDKLPEHERNKLRYWGIGLAMVMRLLLLAFISWILKLDQTLFSAFEIEVILLDLVFSVDSIITAVGMVQELWVMYTAVIVTVIIMLIASKPISNFIKQHPSFKILALCFLMMIGVSLLAEGFQFKIPKGYIYFSMAFAFLVDIIQMRTVHHTSKNTK